MADTVDTVTIDIEPRTVPDEYFYFLHVSSYPSVVNTDPIFTNDSTLSIAVTTTHTLSENPRNATSGDRRFWEQCLIAVVLSSIALAAMIGNVLVIAAVGRYRRLRSVTNCFVVSLALADLLVSILVLPLNIVVEVTGQWVFGSIVCDLWVSSDVLLCTSSILNLCCISLDRYFAITRPLVYSTRRNKRLAIFMVAVAWGLAAVVTCPPIFGWKEEGRDLANGCSLTRDPGYIIYSSCGSFFIPLLVMLFVYARIYHVATKREKRLRPYWRTFFDGHQRQLRAGSNESTVSKRQFRYSASVDGDKPRSPASSSRTSSYPVTGLSRGVSSSSTGAGADGTAAAATGRRPTSFTRATKASMENEDFNCHMLPQTTQGKKTRFLHRFKLPFSRGLRSKPRCYHQKISETTMQEKRNASSTGSQTKRTSLTEDSDDSSTFKRGCIASNASSSNSKSKTSKNKLRLFSSCSSHQQRQQSPHQQLHINQGNDDDNRGNASQSMTQASIPLLAPMASFNDEFNSGDEDESAINLVSINPNKNKENDSTKMSLTQCIPSRTSPPVKTATAKQPENPCCKRRRRLIPSSKSKRRSNRSSPNTDSPTEKSRLKRRLGLDRRRMIPRRYITSLSSRASRLSLKSWRPTLEITPPSPSPGANRSVTSSVTNSSTAANPTTRRNDSESAKPRHLHRLPAETEETSAVENRRRNRVVERSLYMKERKTAKTLAIVVGCFVVCWLPFFLVYVIDVFCTQCHVTPTLFSALTWLGYFNSALNPLIYALYNTGFRHAFWNLTLGLCFAGNRRPSHLLPTVTVYGGRATGANPKSISDK